MSKTRPDEVYNLAAQSHVMVSFQVPEYTAMVDGLGTLRILDAIRECGLEKKTRFYQASTSELYGKVFETPQTEKTPFYPRSPYGVAKLFGYWTVVNHREAFGIFACNGILFNHESPRRGPTFVTRKITRAVARIHKGLQHELLLGNINSVRDWGHARDYVKAMWLMLQQDVPEDLVVGTGEGHSVREFVEEAFSVVGIKIQWRGEGLSEEGLDSDTGAVIVKIDPRYFRPTEVDALLSDPSQAKKQLGWEPQILFKQLVREMVEADIALVEKGDLNS